MVFGGEGVRLRIGLVQMLVVLNLETSSHRMVHWAKRAASEGARVVVFPEGALWTGRAALGRSGHSAFQELWNVGRGLYDGQVP